MICGGLVRECLDPAGEHDGAEGTADRDLLGAGGECLAGSVLVDAGADGLVHEHAGTARPTAEGLVPVAVHLPQIMARGTEQLTRRVEDLVVAAEETGVVVGDGSTVLGAAGYRGEEFFADQLVQDLGVVDHVVVAVEVRVLVAQGVEAVGAGGDDGALPLRHALEHGVEGADVLLGEHLEQKLVAGAPGGIAGAGLALGEHRELHTRGVEEFDDGAGRLDRLIVVGTGAADPEEVFGVAEVGDVLTEHGDLDAVAACGLDPGGAVG